MDDFFDDFDDFDEGMDGDFEDNWHDEPSFEDEPVNEDKPTKSDHDFWDGPGEQDWAIIFPLSEEISREKRERKRIRRDNINTR